MATITETVSAEIPNQSSYEQSSAPLPSPAALRASLEQHGFVIIPSVLTTLELEELRAAATTLTSQARAGQYPYLRTLPKQFPPWSSNASEGIWGVQHLMHPSMPIVLRDVFVRSYFNTRLLKVMKALLAQDDEEIIDEQDLVMELYNMLVRPDRNFELRWHRDAIKPTATDSEELEILGQRQWFAQWNTALYDDSSLVVVPGSHRRARTAAERAADPFESNMPGQKVVNLKAGDTVFYNNNILHRGVYDSTVERMTLHGSMGHIKGGNQRAVNILQHGVGEWVGQVSFEALEPDKVETASRMRANLLRIGTQAGKVGYAQDD